MKLKKKIKKSLTEAKFGIWIIYHRIWLSINNKIGGSIFKWEIHRIVACLWIRWELSKRWVYFKHLNFISLMKKQSFCQSDLLQHIISHYPHYSCVKILLSHAHWHLNYLLVNFTPGMGCANSLQLMRRESSLEKDLPEVVIIKMQPIDTALKSMLRVRLHSQLVCCNRYCSLH